MKRVVSLIVAVLMLIGVASAEMIRTDDSTMFAQGIELLRQINDLRSVEAAEDVFASITSGFNNANYFKMYAQALEDLHNGEYSSALMRLDILEGDNTFAAMLKQYSLPSCESVRVYTEGRQAEEEGRYDDASELYAQANILDSLDRIFELKSRATELTYERAVALFDEGKYAEAADLFTSLGNYMDSAERARQATALIPTPEPTPTPSPTPLPTPTPSPTPTPKPTITPEPGLYQLNIPWREDGCLAFIYHEGVLTWEEAYYIEPRIDAGGWDGDESSIESYFSSVSPTSIVSSDEKGGTTAIIIAGYDWLKLSNTIQRCTECNVSLWITETTDIEKLKDEVEALHNGEAWDRSINNPDRK